MTANHTLYARWNLVACDFDVNYIIDGEEVRGLNNAACFDLTLGNRQFFDKNDFYTKENERVSPGTTYSITNIRSLPGYRFAGVASSSEYGLTGTVDTQRVEVWLNYETKTYTVNYHANAGSDPVVNLPSNQTKVFGIDLTLSGVTPGREGYVFLGWGKDAVASSGLVNPGTIYSDDANLELFALWKLSPGFSLPMGLTTIEEEAFANNAFTCVFIPVTVTKIGSKAFSNCPNLRAVEILADEVDIAVDAFSDVTGLTIYCHKYSDAEWYAKQLGFEIKYID
ncbi:MAG: leucine-rich repeat protein [Blautia sp.]|nr:leucine-rich repeat protein [Blautia sp.]